MGASSSSAAKRSARILAVQSLYQLESSDVTPQKLLQQLSQPQVVLIDDADTPQGELEKPDMTLARHVVSYAIQHRATIEELLKGALSVGYDLARMERLLRVVFHAAIAELLSNTDQKPALLINDYLDVTHAFFSQNEHALVNGVLDKVAKAIRS
ncbi:MAG: transcription antitermination factor NusB [Alphaproteobacteria bacterium]|nr:transcription antitermination factor NusB [Alphaproteobacteria bacterium]NDC56136.1 transcription antitermination factor NusB [Alphaproteobacteria bacterium]NDG05449.1 transcription antitermination factor NusB [Alphaproteobacteria bacterium]